MQSLETSFQKMVGPPTQWKKNGVFKFPDWRKVCDFRYYLLDFRELVPVLLEGFETLEFSKISDRLLVMTSFSGGESE